MTDRPRFTVGRIAVITVVVGLAVMWVYVLFIGKSREDKLHDTSFAPKAQAVCSQTLTQLRNANVVDQKAPSPQARAELADRADQILAAQVEELRAISVADTKSRNAVNAWLDDWSTWLGDRAVWVEQQRAGKDTQFYEHQDSTGAPRSKALNDFAISNGMAACATPAGV